MDDKIKILLDKINIDEDSYQYFNDAKISKVKVSPKTKSWNIYIEKNNLLPLNIYKELEEKKYSLDNNAKKIEFIYNINNPNINVYLEYYDYLLDLLKDDLKVKEIYKDSMKIENDFLTLIATNETEEEKLKKVLSKISKFYKKIGYNFNIDIELREEDNILEEIQHELENIEIPEIEKHEEKKENTKKEKKYYREKKNENCVIGRNISEEPIKIKTIIGDFNEFYKLYIKYSSTCYYFKYFVIWNF